ncbi:MAG: hypothetical protein WBF53_11555, partial [Litorimonas sp.]
GRGAGLRLPDARLCVPSHLTTNPKGPAMDFTNHARMLVTDALHDRTFPDTDAVFAAARAVQPVLRKRGGEAEFAAVTPTMEMQDGLDGTLIVTADEAPEGTNEFTSTARITLQFGVKRVAGGLRLSLWSAS